MRGSPVALRTRSTTSWDVMPPGLSMRKSHPRRMESLVLLPGRQDLREELLDARPLLEGPVREKPQLRRVAQRAAAADLSAQVTGRAPQCPGCPLPLRVPAERGEIHPGRLQVGRHLDVGEDRKSTRL